jgi:hypothetical protein
MSSANNFLALGVDKVVNEHNKLSLDNLPEIIDIFQ